MAVYRNELYVAGYFQTAGGITANSIAKWNGSTWSAVGLGVSNGGGGGSITSLAVYNDRLYACGFFTNAGTDSALSIARWDGTTWSSLPNVYSRYSPGSSGGYGICITGEIPSMHVFNGKLYIGGNFPYNCTILPQYAQFGICIMTSNIAVWDDTVLLPVVDTIVHTGILSSPFPNSNVRAITSYGNELYALGTFDTAGHSAVDNIAKYNGYTWEPVPAPFHTSQGFYMPISTYQGSLIAEVLIGSGVGIGKFNGNSWPPMGSEFLGSSPGYADVCEWNGDLYVGGSFTHNGSTSVMNIAKWSNATGIQGLEANREIAIYPNPTTGSITIENLEPYAPITISDIVGQTLLTDMADQHGAKGINVSMFPKGLYFINNLKFVKD
jgi:hypothetical protein